MGELWERIYPLLFSGVIGTVVLLFDFRPNVQGFEKVLDGVITFSSIVVGFLGALLAVILSLSNTKVIELIYSYTRKSILTKKNKIVFFLIVNRLYTLGLLVC